MLQQAVRNTFFRFFAESLTRTFPTTTGMIMCVTTSATTSVSRRVIFKQGAYELRMNYLSFHITFYSRFKALPVGKSPTGLKPF